jgi:hypothetical protein
MCCRAASELRAYATAIACAVGKLKTPNLTQHEIDALRWYIENEKNNARKKQAFWDKYCK